MARHDIRSYHETQVFLNYPFDDHFLPLSRALHFGVVAAGLIPLCAHDMTSPDQLRLQMIATAIANCDYSLHDLSRYLPDPVSSLPRFNMPLELGMSVFFAHNPGMPPHRFAFFVSTRDDYHKFASDLSGLDPKFHNNDELTLVILVYEWLRSVAPNITMAVSSADVRARYVEFSGRLSKINGSRPDGSASHDEFQELMYSMCSEMDWWDWRKHRQGQREFPELPLRWKT